ncbi:hypothetical protein GF319_13425, partial [Candidatus Bathyarchaeota archaeon]|nr:hypothetical protein [Candidatus Bathyarchaeota archaeon]
MLKPKFLLDGMLGSLTRWLRISGFDAMYQRNAKDADLIKESIEDNRILLTRDRELVERARKMGVEAYFISGTTSVEKLVDLRKKLDLSYSPQISRCPRCNGVLREVEKARVSQRVPEASYIAFDDFWECKECGTIYWKGSHWKKLKNTLN